MNEFKIQNFELFVNTIYEKFVQSCIYEFTNRISDLNNLNYGKPKSTKPSVVLSKELVISLCKKILTETINYYLPRQDNKTQTNTLAAFETSLDEVSDILQRSESDTIYNAKLVEYAFTQVSVSSVNETQFTLDTFIKETGVNTNTVLTADGEAAYKPTDPPTETETSTTGGGASGPTDPSQGPTGQIDNENRQNWKQEVAGGQKPRLGIQ